MKNGAGSVSTEAFVWQVKGREGKVNRGEEEEGMKPTRGTDVKVRRKRKTDREGRTEGI